MQLDYNVLWIDDNNLWRQTAVRKIKKCVTDCGFFPIISEYSNGNNIFQEKFNLSSFDLIFMDYDIKDPNNANIDTGLELIKQIRNSKIYSNIIFYSSITNDLPEKVKEQGIQNTYIFEREDFRDENIDTITEVIEYILNRANSINIMRGIMMAELAEFDNQILNIISNAEIKNKWNRIFDLITHSKQRHCKDLIKNSSDLADKREELKANCNMIRLKNDIENIKRSIYDENKSTAIFPSSLRADFLNSIIKETNIKLSPENDFVTNFVPEIIKKRNKLGHCINISESSDEEFLLMRKNILKHRKNLNEISKIFLNLNYNNF